MFGIEVLLIMGSVIIFVLAINIARSNRQVRSASCSLY